MKTPLRPCDISHDTYACSICLASFPGFPALERGYVYTRRARYFFSHDHDVIKIKPNGKATFCVFFNQLCVQHLVCIIFGLLIARYV